MSGYIKTRVKFEHLGTWWLYMIYSIIKFFCFIIALNIQGDMTLLSHNLNKPSQIVNVIAFKRSSCKNQSN